VEARRRISGLKDVWQLWSDRTYRSLAQGYHLPDGSRRVYCYHVRKTAGTSLHLSFMALGGEDPYEVLRRVASDRLHRTVSGPYAYAAFHPKVLAEGAYFYGRSHRGYEDQPLPPGTFTVTVLRDPVRRVHSYFDYLVEGDRPGTPGAVRKRERRLAADGFDAFLARVPPADLLAQLAMFSARYDVAEAHDRIAGCSSVLLTEHFDQGLGSLATRLDLPLTVRQDRVTGRRSQLSDAQLERVRSMVAPEYELLEGLRGSGVLPAAPLD
jgi:hypothetical protein